MIGWRHSLILSCVNMYFLILSACLIAGANAVIDDRGLVLTLHNTERALVNVSDLSWSEDLAKKAEAYALTCSSGHSNAPHENLAYGRPFLSTEDAIQLWIDEKKPGSKIVGHYLQMINPKNVLVGCAHATCYHDWHMHVCQYGRKTKRRRRKKKRRRRKKQ